MEQDGVLVKKVIAFKAALQYWLKLGFISFGGPAGQIAIMHQDLVEKQRWISENRFLHALNYCMLLPGPEAQQLATYIGWLMHGIKGGLAAGILFILPSFFILIALTWLYLAYNHLPVIAGIFYGIKPAVVAIVLFAAYRIGSRTLKNKILWGIAILAFLAIFFGKVPFPLIVLVAALLGWMGSRWQPQWFQHKNSHSRLDQRADTTAIIDDHTPLAPHAQFNVKKLIVAMTVILVTWVVVFAGLWLWQGWDGIFTKMGWFFTKAALLTFGGAYAVLPYVYQAAVEHYHWLTATQMIDGLALGETTPGPLIMIVTFVGFVGAWMQAAVGTSLVLAGLIGASVATFFTFLPSFFFILVGAPLIETTHGNLKFTAPLTAITAAVVGVIVNLALFFAYHVFWPTGFDHLLRGFDGIAALIALNVFIALVKYNLSIVKIIFICALVGVASNYINAFFF